MQEAIIFGAGNIGRGFIGQLFCESGCRVVFVDVDDALIAALNRAGSYRLETVFNEDVQAYRVGPVRALHGVRDAQAVQDSVAAAAFGATAVGAGALKHIVPTLAAGLARRAARQPAPGPFNLILCENLKGAAATVRGLVQAALPPALHGYLREQVGFVDTVIGRMVPAPTPEMRAADPGLIRTEPYKELPVERAGFVGPVPAIAAMAAYDHFPVFTARKLYLHNCGHALLAYLGHLRGHEFGYEALADPVVHTLLGRGLGESQAGIVARYGADPAWLAEHIADLLRRFANRVLGDTIFRLGRDPLRKLQPADRLVGAARLAEAAGIEPRHLALGIAAAFRFDPAEDPVSRDLQAHVRAAGLPAVLTEVCGIRADEPLGQSVLAQHAALTADATAHLATLARAG
jgi:mannitol-1-phosphate 5-dehydrogenase